MKYKILAAIVVLAMFPVLSFAGGRCGGGYRGGYCGGGYGGGYYGGGYYGGGYYGNGFGVGLGFVGSNWAVGLGYADFGGPRFFESPRTYYAPANPEIQTIWCSGSGYQGTTYYGESNGGNYVGSYRGGSSGR